MRLATIIKDLGAKTVTIRGADVRVRPLTALEVAHMERQLPHVGTRRDIHPKGAAHGLVVDHGHPQTVREQHEANRIEMALRCAIGMGVEDGPDGPWRADMDADAARRLADHVLGVLTWGEINAVVGAQHAITHPAAAEDAERIGTDTHAGN